MTKEFKGRVFKKSSISNAPKPYPPGCVYVSISEKDVLVANLDNPDPLTTQFTHKEWDAFIRGVKHGEFDLE